MIAAVLVWLALASASACLSLLWLTRIERLRGAPVSFRGVALELGGRLRRGELATSGPSGDQAGPSGHPGSGPSGLRASGPSGLWALALALGAILALVPLAGVHGPASSEWSGVAVDADWGLHGVLAVLALVVGSRLWSRAAAPTTGRGIRLLSLLVPGAASVAGLSLVAGSLSPLELVRAQDAVVRPLGIPLPAWGIFLQPLGFLIFAGCLSCLPRARPDEPRGAAGWLAEAAWVPVMAMVAASLFLGGYAIPYVSAQAAQKALVPSLGATGAGALLTGLQGLCFLAKTTVVVLAWARLRERLRRLDDGHAVGLLLGVATPLALVNLLATALALLWLEAPGA